MSCKVQQSVCSDCVTYVKSRIKFNTFNTFNNVIDKEYIKEIISRITKKKADGNIVPATASMQEIMIVIREDALECMRVMCNEREIAVNRTLNSVSFKCL